MERETPDYIYDLDNDMSLTGFMARDLRDKAKASRTKSSQSDNWESEDIDDDMSFTTMFAKEQGWIK